MSQEDNKIEFTPEQQTKFDEVLQTRLAEQREALRKEFQALLPSAPSESTPSAPLDPYLAQSRAKREAEDAERTELARLFGPKSDGMAAQSLKRSDPDRYVRLRGRAQFHKLIAGDDKPPVGKLTMKSFEKSTDGIKRYGSQN